MWKRVTYSIVYILIYRAQRKRKHEGREYLLQKGANPLMPEHFNQYEHIKDLEDDCSNQSGVIFDLSDLKKLFDRYL